MVSWRLEDGIGVGAASLIARPSADQVAADGALLAERDGGRARADQAARPQTMMTTMAPPKTSIRHSSRPRNTSKPPIITSAAMATPSWLPRPPSTTIARMIALSMKVKLSGLMKAWRVAKKAPAKPPNMAPSAKAVSLVVVMLMPSARQAISSSRNASQARPSGWRRSRRVTQLVSSARARIR